MKQKKKHPQVKAELHPRNKHRERYDFKQLVESHPALGAFVRENEYGDESVSFSDPQAVIALNKALLKHYYGLKHWSIPEGFLCPPVPGRADYIHHIADLLSSCNDGVIPTGSKLRGLDVGVGANCIYPIVGHAEYGWSFVGAEIDAEAYASASSIVSSNDGLRDAVEIRQQPHARDTFCGMIRQDEYFDFTVCNPPFHASQQEAEKGNLRKTSSLNKKSTSTPVLNFGGKSQELYCPGGEERFVKSMISQSKLFADSCYWFTTLLSKKDNVRPIKVALKKAGAVEVRVVPMSQGTKVSRFVAWTFLSVEQQREWVAKRF